jgi:hypothetical protein
VNTTMFWDIALCSYVKVNGYFEEPSYLYLQVIKMNHVRNQSENKWQADPKFRLSSALVLACCFDICSTVKMQSICSSKAQGYFNDHMA